jgi:LCP family protein required for cell wall assembly
MTNRFAFLKNIKIKKPSIGQIIFLVITLGLTVALFIFGRSFIACWTMTALPGSPLPFCGTTGPKPGFVVNGKGTPEAIQDLPTPEAVAPEIALPDPWDGASRVNILFIGVDYGDWSEDRMGASRSDTMILFTIDPLSKTAGMLSIPRDLWVNIPGHGYGKINTAYYIGDAFKLPGGGPALAMKTVEQVIGVPVHYYAQVDFQTFIDMIDEIGGIDIYIPETRLILDRIGPGQDKVALRGPGMRHLNGWKTLAYARIRKQTEGGDVDRSERQMRVIMGIRDKVLDPENFPMLVAKAPKLYAQLSSGIHTNLSLDDALELAVLAKDIPPENIKKGIINYEMVTLTKSPDGLDIFKPITDKIRLLRDEIFTSTGATGPMATGDPAELMRTEAPRVRILNGASGIPQAAGLAARTADYFASQGITVVEMGDAGQAYSRTTLTVYTSDLYTLRYLITLFGVNSNAQISFKYEPASPVDIEVRLGNDWALNNPMP